jgi:molybdate transport system regulatory protein
MQIEGRFWLKNNSHVSVGPGRIELLERIRDCGSMNEAAKQMKMSYRAAWDYVNAVNTLAAQPVVVRVTGGRSGGGTQLTPYGTELIATYRAMEREHRAFLDSLNARFQDKLGF